MEQNASTPTLRPDILAHYELGQEADRLSRRSSTGRLEFLRTKDLLTRALPAPPARVLDIGGGSGVYAAWLVQQGYRVELVDPVPLHVEQAGRQPGVSARLGDARDLHDVADASFDVVLLLGPLYHLQEPEERLAALGEARRITRPGGVVAAATINRFSGLHDALAKGVYYAPERRAVIDPGTEDGRHRPTDSLDFTTAFFHAPEQIAEEFAKAGLATSRQYGIEGAAWLMPRIADDLDDPERTEILLTALRRTESVSSLLGASSHLLTVAVRD